MEDRFRYRTGPQFGSLTEGVLAPAACRTTASPCSRSTPGSGCSATTAGPTQALTVLDRCRIRWGRVLQCPATGSSVEFRPLTWDGRRLASGRPRWRPCVRAIDGVGLASAPVVGDWVALHWEWVCDRLTQQQVRLLKTYTDRHMAIVNRAGWPAAMLG